MGGKNMGPLKEFRDYHYNYSKQASTLSRQLAYAGIAVIWVFKTSADGQPSVPHALFWPGAFFIVALALDLLQCVTGSAIWSAFYNRHFKRLKNDEAEVIAPRWLKYPIYGFYFSKIGAVLVGYMFLLGYLVRNL